MTWVYKVVGTKRFKFSRTKSVKEALQYMFELKEKTSKDIELNVFYNEKLIKVTGTRIYGGDDESNSTIAV